MSDAAARIGDNLAAVRERMSLAAARAGRSHSEARLVAVTKYVSAEVTRQLVEAGCHDLGESRAQDLWAKAESLKDLDIRWHLIGHLQRNKVARCLPLASLIHSCDSPRLAVELAVEAVKQGLARPAILIEVNVSGDATKHGFPIDLVEPALAEILSRGALDIRGLMCMAALDGGVEVARRNFHDLRALRDRLRTRFGPAAPLDELSMGMSGDFEIAIEEGATHVRIGTALFEGL